MHVAHFVQRVPPALGGSEAYFERLAAFHRAQGDSVTTWTTTAIDLEAFWFEGKRETKESIPPHPYPAPAEGEERIWRYPPKRFPFRRYLLKAASLIPIPKWQALTLPCNPICPAMWHDAGRYDGPLDAVHATAFPYAFPILCGLRLARRRGVPFVLTPFLHLGNPGDAINSTKRQYTSRPLRWLLRQADRIFVQTNLEREAVIELGIEPAKVVKQGLGVDPAECTGGNRERWRQSFGIVPDEVVIGHLANNSVEKGTTALVSAGIIIPHHERSFRIMLAGPEMSNFRSFWDQTQTVENSFLSQRVRRLGILTEDQKRDFFSGIDVFCLPSRSDSFGLVILEAWANAKPVVVLRAGGPSELVNHERDGLVANTESREQLAALLKRMISDRDLRNRMGHNGLARVMGEFQWPEKLSLVRETILGVKPAPSVSA